MNVKDNFTLLAISMCETIELIDDDEIYDPYAYPKPKNKPETDIAISVSWCAGGATGGSCWGGTAHYMEGDAEPEWTALNDFLLVVAPNLTFKDFLIINKNIKNIEKYNNEYYGNYSIYKYKYLKIDDLYNTLKSLNALVAPYTIIYQKEETIDLKFVDDL